MNHPLVVVAGASGNLGRLVVAELLTRGARVRALTRSGPNARENDQKTAKIGSLGAEIHPINYDDSRALTRACEGAEVVVSTLCGLRPVIIGTQTRLLEAAEAAGVSRFIPSDFSIDYTEIPLGANRNLNLRSEFQSRLDRSRIRATSILNGAFADMLTGTAPFVLFKFRKILCWGDPDQLMAWTTTADTARYTAAAALDPGTPRFLKIAGDQVSARSLADIMTALTGKTHKILRPGGPAVFGALIRFTRLTTPKSDEIYPPWQGMQYMHNMYSGLGTFDQVDNGRYPMQWTSVQDVLRGHLKLP